MEPKLNDVLKMDVEKMDDHAKCLAGVVLTESPKTDTHTLSDRENSPDP